MKVNNTLSLFNEKFQEDLDAHCSYNSAGAFRNIYRYSHRLQIQLVSESLTEELNPEKLLLDAGCWCGPYSILFSDKAKVVGIDSSTTSIRRAKSWRNKNGKHSKIDFIVADINSLPFKSESFDAVICLEVLEHLQKIALVLKELDRVAKRKAIGIISMPNSLSLYYIFQRLFQIGASKSENSHFNHNFKEIKNIISTTGFEVLFKKSSLIIPIAIPLWFHNRGVRLMRFIERKLNKTPFQNLGAHIFIKFRY